MIPFCGGEQQDPSEIGDGPYQVAEKQAGHSDQANAKGNCAAPVQWPGSERSDTGMALDSCSSVTNISDFQGC